MYRLATLSRNHISMSMLEEDACGSAKRFCRGGCVEQKSSSHIRCCIQLCYRVKAIQWVLSAAIDI